MENECRYSYLFKIFPLQEGYIVHGELEITKLDKEGSIEWQFSGADIFVSNNGKEEFVLTETYILLTDWTQREYKIGFDGKELLYFKSDLVAKAGKLH